MLQITQFLPTSCTFRKSQRLDHFQGQVTNNGLLVGEHDEADQKKEIFIGNPAIMAANSSCARTKT